MRKFILTFFLIFSLDAHAVEEIWIEGVNPEIVTDNKYEDANKKAYKKRYDQCQTIKQKLYDDCILKNLKTSDATSANIIRDICKRKSEDIPLSTAIFYKNFYAYGFVFCDIKAPSTERYRYTPLSQEESDALKRRLYGD